MAKQKFTVIKGGLESPSLDQEKFFVSATTTDTRLMGVIGLHIHWKFKEKCIPNDFHQFFYLDSEEFGFETYQSLFGDDMEEITLVENALIGGLGGEKVDITEKEAIYLIQEYAKINERLSQPFPQKEKEYEFLLKKEIFLTNQEKRELIGKICTPICSDYHVINYFLMRCFGKDFTAANYLCLGNFKVDIYDDMPPATFCKNTIDRYANKDNYSYMCESLIEAEGSYYVIISEVTTEQRKITSYEKHSKFKVSESEAAMMLSRPEFITLYDILIEPEVFDKQAASLTINTMVTIHENGKLFLSFNKNNDHVNNRIYRLNEDVYGLYYITDFGQLIIASYNIQNILELEKNLRNSLISHSIIPIAKYEFKEPILYEFIQSGFDDFNDFLDFIKE